MPGGGRSTATRNWVAASSAYSGSMPGAMSWLAGEPCLHVAPLDRAEQPAFWSGDDRGMHPAAAERSANSAVTAAIWHNHKTGQPVLRSLIAYDHS